MEMTRRRQQTQPMVAAAAGAVPVVLSIPRCLLGPTAAPAAGGGPRRFAKAPCECVMSHTTLSATDDDDDRSIGYHQALQQRRGAAAAARVDRPDVTCRVGGMRRE